MIDAHTFKDYRVAVLGLGRSGLASAHALVRGGADVLCWDDGIAARAHAEDEGLRLADLAECDFDDIRSLVLSPGIPLTFPAPHPVVMRAAAAGAEIIGDIEILGREQKGATFVGITGTNGKSTTTALVGHILKAAGRTVEVGGNIGAPVLSLRPMAKEGGAYVLEMSSYQLDLVHTLVFDVSALLNVSADHLDRHGGMGGYIEAKKRIFQRQGKGHVAVIGMDDDACRAIFDDLKVADGLSVVPVSVSGAVDGGVYVEDGTLTDATAGGAVSVLDLTTVATLPGRHNWQNAAVAYAVVRALGLKADEAAAGIGTYPGLAHRQERIAATNGITYINDSKATNADAAARALQCYDAIYWIAGGRAKEGGISGLLPHLGGVRHAFLIGESADDFAAQLDGHVPVTHAGTLEAAVRAATDAATKDATAGAVVLLSPAAASFDQFRDFEDRGEAFRALVPGQDKKEGAA